MILPKRHFLQHPFGGIIADISSNSRVEDRLFNGKPYTKSYIDYADLLAGGTLRLIMGPSPSKWGTAKKDRP